MKPIFAYTGASIFPSSLTYILCEWGRRRKAWSAATTATEKVSPRLIFILKEFGAER
jgi:hypothetical protein